MTISLASCGSSSAGRGEALIEEMVYDRASGQLLSGSFLDYAMPRADIMPDIAAELALVPTKTNLLGVKGGSEAGNVATPAAIVNAHRFIFDSRDEAARDRLRILGDKSGVFRCRTVFNCTEDCPRGIKVTKAIQDQAATLVHSSTLFPTAPIVDLAEKIASLTPGDLTKTFFTNSGTEADETAVMLARAATGNQAVIALRHAYAGRSMMATTLTAHATLREVADNRKLRFDVEVREGDRVIGVGTHERRVIDVAQHASAAGSG